MARFKLEVTDPTNVERDSFGLAVFLEVLEELHHRMIHQDTVREIEVDRSGIRQVVEGVFDFVDRPKNRRSLDDDVRDVSLVRINDDIRQKDFFELQTTEQVDHNLDHDAESHTHQ